MKRNKHSALSGKAITLIVSIMALAAMTVGGTLAWLAASTNDIENRFAPSDPDIEIREEFDGSEKRNVKVENVGDLDMYVRVNLVFTWTNAQGHVIEKPATAEVDIDYGSAFWVQGTDGYWYYTKPLKAGYTTENLIDEATATFPQGMGYGMDLEVLAQSIQAMPVSAVEGEWPVTVNTSGSLSVQ